MIYSNDEFRKKVVKYLDENWDVVSNVDQIADAFEYAPRYFEQKFKSCYGISFMQYLKKLKIHRIALKICEENSPNDVWKLSGYSNTQSFSKAFRNEIGVSPRNFFDSNMEIPDMPVHSFIYGHPITVEYVDAGQVISYGDLLNPVHGLETDLLEECGYCFDYYEEDILEKSNDGDWIGVWWYGKLYDLKYFIGKVLPCKDSSKKDMSLVHIPADYYAVISFERKYMEKEDRAAASFIVKKLAHFVFDEWTIINRKNVKKMGYTYERYSKDKISIYVPLYKRNNISSGMYAGKGPVAWIKFIEENLVKNLSISEIASEFYYSEQHFRDTFAMYYGISLSNYLKKRKLYLIAQKLQDGESNITNLIEKYGFQSFVEFENDFYDEFSTTYDQYKDGEYCVEDLTQYYTDNKDILSVNYTVLQDFEIFGTCIVVGIEQGYSFNDLIECIAYRLQVEQSEQYVIWQENMESGEPECYSGGMEAVPQTGAVPRRIEVQGGMYAVLSASGKEKEDLAETYRLLYRCAFSGWIRENMVRVDMEKLTFAQYKNGQLYFYIPITG